MRKINNKEEIVEYNKLRVAYNRMRIRRRDFAILTDRMYRFKLKDSASSYGLSMERIRQIQHKELMRFNHICRMKHPITKKILRNANQLTKKEWDDNTESWYEWKLWNGSPEQKLLALYITFMIARLDQTNRDLKESKHYNFIKYVNY